jgi:dynein heavy chain
LKDYLEKKCAFFCRFYFLSNDDLLEILSETKEVRKVRAHLQKVFEGVADLDFRPDDTMWGVISPEKESIALVKRVDPKDRGVEFWMSELEKQMLLSVREALKIGIKTYDEVPRVQWVKEHAGQIVLNGSQVFWTKDVEKGMLEGGVEGVKKYFKFLNEQRADTVKLVQGKLDKLAKTSINALIVIDVHALDVVGDLLAK